MDKNLKIAFFCLLLFGIAAIGLLSLFSSGVIVLSPKGMIGQKQSTLLLISTIVMLFVVIPVFLLTFFIAWKYRIDNKKAQYRPEWDNSHLAELIWWGFPLIIIIILGALTWEGCHKLDPFRPIESKVKPLKIQVVALQWKWLFIYPEQKIASLNFMQIPEQTPIEFEITSDAPMNSFWIPELGGQVYAMAGMRSKLHLMADEPGTYRGFSANISGTGFSGMTFMAKASSRQEFDDWAASMRGGPSLNFEEYSRLVKPSSYVPVAHYALSEEKLFDWIVMKYMKRMDDVSSH